VPEDQDVPPTPPLTVVPVTAAPAEPAEKPTGPIRLTRQQCLDNMDELTRKQTYLWDTRGYFREPLGSGITEVREESIRTTVTTALGYHSNSFGGTCYELVDQELAAKIATQRVNANGLLGKSIVEMLKVAPLNLTARAKVMAVVGTMPAPELDTWDKIKEWIESSYEPRVKSGPTVKDLAPPPPNTGFPVRLSFSDVETGTCCYSVNRSARGNYQVTTELIRRIMVEKEPSSLNDLRSEIHQAILDNAWEAVSPDMEWQGETEEHSDYDYNDTSNHQTCLRDGSGGLRDQLRDYINTHMPDLRAQLGMDTPF